jgi:hypothetical protein
MVMRKPLLLMKRMMMMILTWMAPGALTVVLVAVLAHVLQMRRQLQLLQLQRL